MWNYTYSPTYISHHNSPSSSILCYTLLLHFPFTLFSFTSNPLSPLSLPLLSINSLCPRACQRLPNGVSLSTLFLTLAHIFLQTVPHPCILYDSSTSFSSWIVFLYFVSKNTHFSFIYFVLMNTHTFFPLFEP